MKHLFWRRRGRLAGRDGPEADDRGATATEYALMTGFIAAVIVAAVAALGTQVDALFQMGLTGFG